jgi:MoxR-like ATPase
MSRYNQYTSASKDVLARARMHALREGASECRPCDLIASLVGDVPSVSPSTFFKGSASDTDINTNANERGPSSPIITLPLSFPLRQILTAAERKRSGLVSEADLLRATVEVCRKELAAYLASSTRRLPTPPHGDSAVPADRVAPPSKPSILTAGGLDCEALEARLRASVLGQDHAITLVCDALALRYAGLDVREERPAGVFLFCGPSGVGKTEFATTLARALFPPKRGSAGSSRLLRLDCSEYSEAHQVSRLLGSPPSYIGYDTPSPLEEFLKSCEGRGGVLLLDEFEKAHPALHRLFLQAFDAGRLTTSRGRTLDLRPLIMIATTNIVRPHQQQQQRAVGIGFQGNGHDPARADSRRSRSSKPDSAMPTDELRQVFSLELLNRFDEIIPFQPLSREIADRILTEHLIPAAAEMAHRRHGITFAVSRELAEQVLEEGYSPEFGARHLQRAFRRLVLREWARNITAQVGASRPEGGRTPPSDSSDLSSLQAPPNLEKGVPDESAAAA